MTEMSRRHGDSSTRHRWMAWSRLESYCRSASVGQLRPEDGDDPAGGPTFPFGRGAARPGPFAGQDVAEPRRRGWRAHAMDTTRTRKKRSSPAGDKVNHARRGGGDAGASGAPHAAAPVGLRDYSRCPPRAALVRVKLVVAIGRKGVRHPSSMVMPQRASPSTFVDCWSAVGRARTRRSVCAAGTYTRSSSNPSCSLASSVSKPRSCNP